MDNFTPDSLIHLLFGAVIGLLGVFMGLLTWIGKSYAKRVETLENTAVSKKDSEERHTDNVERLKRIEALIERNHVDSVDGRHRTGNQILTLVSQVARLEGKMEDKR